jgi:hypothetical protein
VVLGIYVNAAWVTRHCWAYCRTSSVMTTVGRVQRLAAICDRY